MTNSATPIDINRPHGRVPARSAQSSNLSSALRTTGADGARPDVGGGAPGDRGNDGVTIQAFNSAAEPISVNASNQANPRRESIAGSMVTGMSWGGTSVGSWIRDE